MFTQELRSACPNAGNDSPHL